MDNEERTRMCETLLEAKGYPSQVDQHGDIIFKDDDRTYLIPAMDGDEMFFCIVFPAFWKIESDEERERAINAVMRATADTKVAKVYLMEDLIYASVELFCFPAENFRSVFDRSLGALKNSVSRFLENMDGTHG